MELVSIIIPSYNHEKFIDDCLKSVCQQTYANIEVIITDDCSQDGTFEIIKKWENKLLQRFENVIIKQNKKNLGVTRNLNNMIAQAKGQYVKILASDDMLVPDSIERLTECVDKTNADIVYGNVIVVDEDVRYDSFSSEQLDVMYNEIQPHGKKLTGEICARNFIPACGAIIPRKTIEKYGVFNEEYLFEDLEYWIRVSIDGDIQYIKEPVAMYRVLCNSLSHFEPSDQGRKKNRVFHEHRVKIIAKYKQYMNFNQTEMFWNDELGMAIDVYDKKLVKDIYRYMHKERLKPLRMNKIRVFFINIGLYMPIRKIAWKFK